MNWWNRYSIVAVLVMMLVGTACATTIFDNTVDVISGESWLGRAGVTITDSVYYSFANPKNTCLKFSFGDNKFSVCGIDNNSKILVDDCETIGFAHAWKENTETVQVIEGNEKWHQGPEGSIIIGPGYITRHTRKCQNCTVYEEEYNEVTPKWRRK